MKILTTLLLISILTSCSSNGSWRTASRKSANIAPKAEDLKESIIQIYAARAYSWRGYFGIHPWVSWKKKEEKEYTVAQVIGWNLRRGPTSVSVKNDLPDRHWYGSKPYLIQTIRGEKADKVIDHIKALIGKYTRGGTYVVFPGPNSNTFVDYLIRNTKEFSVELPATAIGKDFLADSMFLDISPGGYGFQFSIYGLLGLTMGVSEGVEVNLFGLVFGIDFLRPALKLPLIGRLGFPDAPL
jgi:hypothetical protein